jgi:hypothetical protein
VCPGERRYDLATGDDDDPSSEPATFPSAALTPPAGARSESDNAPTSAREAGSIDTGHVEAAMSQRLVEPLNRSEPQTDAIAAGKGVAGLVSASPVEEPVKSAPVKALSEGRAKLAPYKDVPPGQGKSATSAAPARSPVSRGDARRQDGDLPDPAEIIDWLLKEYSPRTE